MNIRISQYCLRFRLQTDELATLSTTGYLEQTTLLGGTLALQTVISVGPLPAERISGALTLCAEQNELRQRLSLTVTPEALKALVEAPDKRDGIEDIQANSDDSELRLVLELDLKPKAAFLTQKTQ